MVMISKFACLKENMKVIQSSLEDNIFDKSKLKAFADGNMTVPQMTIDAFSRIENNAEKGENADYQHFLLLTQCYQKAFFSKVVKS